MTRFPQKKDIHNWIRTLALVAMIGMFIVLISGIAVTDTGSQVGCGHSWPLCRGQFIPQFAFTTAVEFTHRSLTAVETVLILLETAAILIWYRTQKPLKVMAPLLLLGLFGEAAMGAWSVLDPQQPAVLALHFGISLLAVSTTVIAYGLLRQGARAYPAVRSSTSSRVASWSMLAFLLLVVYSGAFIRLDNTGAACMSWPICFGSHGSPYAIFIDLLHRAGGAAAFFIAMFLMAFFRRTDPERKDLSRWARVLLYAILLQGVAGAVLALSSLSLWAELLHGTLAGVLFSVAAWLCLLSMLGPLPYKDGPEGAPGAAEPAGILAPVSS